MIFLHGGSVDSAFLSWGTILDRFSQKFRVYAPDLPGYGDTDKPRIRYSVDFYRNFLHDFLQRLRLEQVHLVGLSMGGHIAWSFALAFPETTHKLILVSPAGLGTKLYWQILARVVVRVPGLHQLIRILSGWTRHSLKLSLRNVVHAPECITEDLLDAVIESARRQGAAHAWRSYLENEMNWTGFRGDFQNDLPRIHAPTLILHGAHDKIVPVKWSACAQQLIPRSRLHIVENAGHWLQREQPKEFIRVVGRFLEDSESLFPEPESR